MTGRNNFFHSEEYQTQSLRPTSKVSRVKNPSARQTQINASCAHLDIHAGEPQINFERIIQLHLEVIIQR